MNKHILRLAKQSGLIQYESDGKMEEVEKFAELIVRECAEVAEDYDGAHYVGTTIKQHFGVSNG